MSKQKIDGHGLIDLATWHELQHHAKDLNLGHQTWYHEFSHHILQFLLDVFKPKSDKKLFIVCGDKTRLPFIKVLKNILADAGIGVSICQLSCKDKTCSLDAFLDTYQDYFAVLDCITPLGPLSLTKRQLHWIASVDQMPIEKIALDCPSGLNPDTGHLISEQALSVNYTLASFYYLKGLWTGLSKAFIGQPILFWDAAINNKKVSFKARLMHESQMRSLMPTRPPFAHKGCFKRVVVIAGDAEMFGAAFMAAKAALLMGAGLVEVLLPTGTNPPHAQLPEVIWHVLSSGFEVRHYLYDEDIVVLGPGLDHGAWAVAVWDIVKQRTSPVVLDASGLAFLALEPMMRPNWIITPHPGEASKLLSCSNHDVQKNRFAAINRLYALYGATTVLKGCGTLVLGENEETHICPLGHAGMATPGMGDVLSGLIAGLWAQHLSGLQAAMLGVWLHAYAAEKVARQSLNGIAIASEVLSQIQHGLGCE